MKSEYTQRIKNENLNFDEYQNLETQLVSFPKVLFVELTQNCNLSCSMCRSSNNYQENLNMEDSIFEILMKEIFPHVSIVDLRGFGESTILKDFEKKLYETFSSGPKIRLVTNALSIKRSLWKALMETETAVTISIDAATAKTMKKLGRGSYEKLLNSIETGCSERDKSNSSGCIYINTVVSSENLEELKDIVYLAKENNIRRITMFPVVATNDNPLHLSNRKDEIIRFLNEATELAIKSNVELRLGASLDDESVVEQGLPERCTHPWEYCYVDYAGNIGYCDHLIGHSSLMLGNLNKNSFIEIWNCKEFIELRSMHNRAKKGGTEELRKLIPHCNWCYQRRYVDFENETNKDAQNRLISTTGKHPLISNNSVPNTSNDFLRGRILPHIKNTK